MFENHWKQSFFLDWIHFERVTHMFSFWGWHSLNLSKSRQFFPQKKIKTGFRPENLLCFARFAITQFVRLDGRVLHAIFCYIIEGLKEKDENSHVQGTAKHLCFYELWETQFYKNFYYWMFCLIKSNKTVQKWLAPQAHNAMRFSISHKNCSASELP